MNKPANPCEQTRNAGTDFRYSTSETEFYDSPTSGDSQNSAVSFAEIGRVLRVQVPFCHNFARASHAVRGMGFNAASVSLLPQPQRVDRAKLVHCQYEETGICGSYRIYRRFLRR